MSWIGVAAVSGALAVLAGAFGAHGLRARVTPELLSAWQTGVLYHLLHSLALLALGVLSVATEKGVTLPAGLMTLGMLLFSGSIYGLVLSQQSWLGPITPVGGLALIAGWLSLLTLLRG